MKKIFSKGKNISYLDRISEDVPIFAKRNGKMSGMVIKEADKGWILRIGGIYGSDGYHLKRNDCIESATDYGYEFYIQE
jgi:hypothetical protein